VAADLAPFFVTGAFTLVAGLGGGLGVATLAQRFQTKREVEARKFAAEQDRKVDERSIRDRKAQRLRESYGALLMTVMQRESAAERWRWLPADYRSKNRDEQDALVKQLIDEARVDLDKTQVALLLESEAHGGEVMEIFTTFNNTLTETFSHVMANMMEQDAQPLGPLLDRLREARAKLGDTARNHLAELEKPI
jgi:hypothetical protein